MENEELWPAAAGDFRVCAMARVVSENERAVGTGRRASHDRVFTDFQCPFCKSLAATVRQVLRERVDAVRVVVRHFPIERIHSGALGAAKAATCAGAVGRFEPMHDLLYASQDSLGIIPWARLAAAAGITDTVDFQLCMGSAVAAEVIQQDTASARQVGVRGTPTVLVNDVVIPWTPTKALLDSLIDSALSRRRR